MGGRKFVQMVLVRIWFSCTLSIIGSTLYLNLETLYISEGSQLITDGHLANDQGEKPNCQRGTHQIRLTMYQFRAHQYLPWLTTLQYS